MTGPEHYREAERLVKKAETRSGPEAAAFDLKAAHVHAMLAVAAATAEPIAQSYDGPDDTSIPAAWSAAIS